MDAKILIVEDESIVALDIRSRLENLGYQVVGMASTGEQAVRAALDLQPDLILMDVKLRGKMDGVEAAGYIHEQSDIPLIFLTAFTDDDTLTRAKITQPFGYILKPFEERELSINIEMALYKHQMQNALRESEERFKLAALGANDGIWDWDLRSNRIFFSDRWKDMLGLTNDGVQPDPSEWFSRIHPEDVNQVRIELATHLEGVKSHVEIEHRIRHNDGSYLWVLTRGLAVRDQHGVAYRISGSQTDITRRKHAEEQLLHDALHDALTGLPNRALFMDRLSHAIERHQRFPDELFAVLFLDMDRFKVINDSLGHDAGDQLLIDIARRIQSILRTSETAARLGGDEFVILLENIRGIEDAKRVAERVQNELMIPFYISDRQIVNTASIGLVLGNNGYNQPNEVLRDADIAMYRAKALGKARYETFDPSFRRRMIDRLDLESRLRGALERQEFQVYYQPIFSLHSNRLSGFEALLRWFPADNGPIPPEEFIPLAEETSLILTIGEWVLREACRQLKKWQADGVAAPELTISVNLSGKQFNHPILYGEVAAILEETGLDPHCLRLEITETVLMEDAEYAKQILDRLTSLGIQIQIDDFGTGYSSLSYLQSFPIQAIKIDRSFISRLGDGDSNTEIVRTIISLAQDLKMSTIAEGLENKTQLMLLRNLRCQFAQGFLYSTPLDKNVARQLLARATGDLLGQAAGEENVRLAAQKN